MSKTEQNSAEGIILYELNSCRRIYHQEDSKIKNIDCIGQISSVTFPVHLILFPSCQIITDVKATVFQWYLPTKVVKPYIQASMNEFVTIKLAFKPCFINKYTHRSCMCVWLDDRKVIWNVISERRLLWKHVQLAETQKHLQPANYLSFFFR